MDLDGSRPADKDAEACAGGVFDGEQDIDPVLVDAVGGLHIRQMVQAGHVVVGVDHPLSEWRVGGLGACIVGKEFKAAAIHGFDKPDHQV